MATREGARTAELAGPRRWGRIADEDLTLRIRARGGRQTQREIEGVKDEVQDLGSEARQTSRSLAGLGGGFSGLGRDLARTRVSLGFFSTSLRVAFVGIGTLSTQIPRLIGPTLGVIEELGVAAGGLGAAGAVGLTTYAQGVGVVTLGLQGMEDALGGDADAMAKLTREQQRFVQGLDAMRPLLDRVRASAARGLLPGLGRGIGAANTRANRRLANQLAEGTGRAIGNIGQRAGNMLGSPEWTRDIRTVGQANIRIIDALGGAGLHLADAFRHVVVEATPLAEWLARAAERGAALTEAWVANQRATGGLSRFFRRARTDLALLGRSLGNIAGGVINLFGAHDVDGRRTLANFERLTQRFEDWTRRPDIGRNLGEAIRQALPEIAGDVSESIARGIVSGGWSGLKLLVQSFVRADLGGKFGMIFLAGLAFGWWRRIGGMIARWILGGMVGRLGGAAAGEALATAVGSAAGGGRVRGRLGGIGRIMGRALGVGLAIGAATWFISSFLDRLANSNLTDAVAQSVTGNPRADLNPRVQRTRENLRRPATRRGIAEWERRHGSVLQRFGATWSPQELAFLRRTHYPGLTPARGQQGRSAARPMAQRRTQQARPLPAITQARPRQLRDAVAPRQQPQTVVVGRMPPIRNEVHVHVDRREIGRAVGNDTARRSERR